MLLPGETFEGYLIDRELGRGGVGIVYKATQLSLNRVVALKLLAPELNSDPEVQARFRNEGITQAAIAHPNVVAVYESGEHDGQLFLAMKYIEGNDLKRLIGSGKLEPEEAIRILAPVAAALDAAHRLGYVHRDVKSRNILIDDDGRAYLADFGLTKGVADRTLGGGIAGTPGYLAPEQIEGRPATPASDVYALAAVLHECLTGRPPTPDAPPAVGDAIGAVLARGLAKQPKRRPSQRGRADPAGRGRARRRHDRDRPHAAQAAAVAAADRRRRRRRRAGDGDRAGARAADRRRRPEAQRGTKPVAGRPSGDGSRSASRAGPPR